MNIQEYISSGIVELYVMGLCSDEEKQELENLKLQYPELNKAIADYEIELEEKMQKNITLPSPDVDEKILKSFEDLQTPVISMAASARKINWLKPMTAAAVILMLVAAYFVNSLNNKTKKLEQELAIVKNEPATLPLADYNIMKDPSITPVAMYGVGTHKICRCTMFWDKKTGKIYIMIHHLPQSSSSRDYQLWAMVDDKPINIGIINESIRGRFIELENVPPRSVAFTVTLEKAGGNLTPTMEEEYMKGKI